jgi:hypothetical protein
MRYLFISLLLFLVVSSGCNRSMQKTADKGAKDQYKQDLESNRLPTAVAPGHCRLEATVLSVLQDMDAQEGNEHCSKAPCRAIVQINKIHGYGSAFTRPLSVDKKLTFDFAFTVGNTKTLGLKMNKHLPGLQKGDRFTADVEEQQQFGDKTAYVVYTYQKLKK